jgi:hypothetical protein
MSREFELRIYSDVACPCKLREAMEEPKLRYNRMGRVLCWCKALEDGKRSRLKPCDLLLNVQQTLESDKMKDYNFTIKPRYYPYLINETLGEDPITKDELYKSKFMG